MRSCFVIGICLTTVFCIVGCGPKSDVPPADQKAYEDRNPADFKGVPPGVGPKGPATNGAPPGASQPKSGN
jgi:predicted small lipoprotein YifL